MLAKIKMYLILAAITGVFMLATNAFTAYKFYGYGADHVQAKWDKSKSQTVNKKIQVKAKQDEVQNAPIDNAVTVRRLRNHSF